MSFPHLDRCSFNAVKDDIALCKTVLSMSNVSVCYYMVNWPEMIERSLMGSLFF